MYVHGNQESDCLRFFSTPGGLGVGHRIRQMFFFWDIIGVYVFLTIKHMRYHWLMMMMMLDDVWWWWWWPWPWPLRLLWLLYDCYGNNIVVIMLCLNHIMRFIRIMIWIHHCGWLRDVTSMITMIHCAWTCKELWHYNIYIYIYYIHILIGWNYPVVGGSGLELWLSIQSPFKKQAASWSY
jgi:hypothetical protein